MKRILIVDDEAHVLRVLKLSLRQRGYEVESICDSREAMDTLRRFAPDVLITDIQMPGLSGRDLCEQIRAEMPQRNFLILVMTAMVARENREWVIRFPNTEFLEKPLSPRSLAARLDQYFAPAAAAAAAA
ncbi:MAG: response regulator [Burkholderiales bacterium]